MRISRPHIRFGQANGFVRSVATFLVLFAFADIAFPQVFCGEETGAKPCNSQALSAAEPIGDSAVEKKASFNPNNRIINSQQNQLPDQAPHEEDCFCCCAHLLLSDAFSVVGDSDPVAITYAPRYDSPVSPPLQSLDHPPRSA